MCVVCMYAMLPCYYGCMCPDAAQYPHILNVCTTSQPLLLLYVIPHWALDELPLE